MAKPLKFVRLETSFKGLMARAVREFDRYLAEDAAEWMSLKKGLHANEGETSAILAINPALVDMERANAEFPPFPGFDSQDFWTTCADDPERCFCGCPEA